MVRCAARGKDQRGPWRGVRAPDAATQCDVTAGRCPAPRTAHRHEQCTCATAECASTRTRACTEPCAHGRCSAACAEQLCQCAWGAWAGVWGTHTRGGWYCGGIPRLHPRRLQITVHFSGLGHQPERHLSAALQPHPRPGAPTKHPNVSPAPPGRAPHKHPRVGVVRGGSTLATAAAAVARMRPAWCTVGAEPFPAPRAARGALWRPSMAQVWRRRGRQGCLDCEGRVRRAGRGGGSRQRTGRAGGRGMDLPRREDALVAR